MAEHLAGYAPAHCIAIIERYPTFFRAGELERQRELLAAMTPSEAGTIKGPRSTICCGGLRIVEKAKGDGLSCV
jgi:hypothetical protein